MKRYSYNQLDKYEDYIALDFFHSETTFAKYAGDRSLFYTKGEIWRISQKGTRLNILFFQTRLKRKRLFRKITKLEKLLYKEILNEK